MGKLTHKQQTVQADLKRWVERVKELELLLARAEKNGERKLAKTYQKRMKHAQRKLAQAAKKLTR